MKCLQDFMPFFYMCPSLQTGAVQPQTPEPLQEDLPVEELHDQETLEPASTPQPKSVPSNDTFTSNSGGKQKKIARKSTPPQAFTSSGKKPFKPIRKKGKKVSLTPVSQPKTSQKRRYGRLLQPPLLLRMLNPTHPQKGQLVVQEVFFFGCEIFKNISSAPSSF